MPHVQPYFGKQALLTHESSHDTFDETKHKNWLVNEAGIGTYAHGRIHQQLGNTIYVGDLIHKRGHLKSDDLLLMEEQALLSMGEPLSVPSKLGSLQGMEVLPMMNTANGEGALIAYYDHGVVSFDTHEAPRETRHDGEGTMTQKGWDTKRLVNHLLNTVGAVGRYAIGVLTRDHLFRSNRGLHFLKVILGEGTFNSENTNTVSQDVSPLLDADKDLDGAAVGFWPHGNRMFATTGLVSDASISSNSFGRGFVSWNQATTFTEDRTPIPIWEGLWRPDSGITGVFRFASVDRRAFGFVCGDLNKNIHYCLIDQTSETDVRAGQDIPIQWSFVTGQFAPSGLGVKSSINDAVIELVVSSSTQRIAIWSRTDADGQWRLWHRFTPADRELAAGQRLLFTESLGRPHSAHREATWIQLRVAGEGFAEIRLIELEHSPSTTKAGRSSTNVIHVLSDDHFQNLNLSE